MSNNDLAEHRADKRKDLLRATEARLERVKASVDSGRLRGKDKIGLRVRKEIDRHKVGKHFDLEIGESTFSYRVNEDRVAAEAQLDGIYVLRVTDRAKGATAVRRSGATLGSANGGQASPAIGGQLSTGCTPPALGG